MVAMGRLSQAVLSHFAGAVITPPFAAWKARHLSPAIGPARFRGQARVPFTLHTLQGELSRLLSGLHGPSLSRPHKDLHACVVRPGGGS